MTKVGTGGTKSQSYSSKKLMRKSSENTRGRTVLKWSGGREREVKNTR